MKIMNIASGSSGNSTLVESDNVNILIDAGVSARRINEALRSEGLSLGDIDAILITHEHADHISALGVIERKYNIPVYATSGTIEGIQGSASLGEFDRELLMPVKAGEAFAVGDISAVALEICHDANEPVCYRVNDGKRSFAAVTDLGGYDERLLESLKDLDGILLEANHDVRMLEVGPYPYPLKQRILGRTGHLSNESSGRLLAKLLHDNIKYILLGHLSRENNTRELAKLAVENEITMSSCGYTAGDFDICVARRDAPSRAALI